MNKSQRIKLIQELTVELNLISDLIYTTYLDVRHARSIGDTNKMSESIKESTDLIQQLKGLNRAIDIVNRFISEADEIDRMSKSSNYGKL